MRIHRAAPRFIGNAPQRLLRALARELGGEVGGPSWLIVPAPGAPNTDRSLQVALSASAPDGFCVVSSSASRLDARAHVLAAMQRIRHRNDRDPDLFECQQS
jgi:hypothetical protein